ncbi:MAG: hypothetical protein MI861_06580, partial [Pirellulales bacterium]|nr:hypothetical protein [Pirellulales bacterium]
NLTQAANLPAFGVSAFGQTKSDAQGVAAGNIGITQGLERLGVPGTLGMGLVAGAGAGVDFRDVPASNGTYARIAALDIINSVGVKIGERLRLGASFTLSNTTLDGPFVGLTGSSTDYGIRGGLGVGYRLGRSSSLGFYWKSKIGHTFENLAGFSAGNFLDVSMDRPEVVGLGIADSSLGKGRLILAMDAVFVRYSDAALLGALYEDQWSLQFGAQFQLNPRVKLRAGYAWSDNPMREIVPNTAGGILPPGGVTHIQYVQSLFAAVPEHRITAGIGVTNLITNVDLDLFAGGLFEDSQTFGTTTASLESYWVGFGLTWQFCCGR